jgi:type IV secretory pathway TrbL component
MQEFTNTLGGVVLILGGFLLIGLLITIPLFFLWNDLMPTLFGLKTISLWQSLELSMLCSLLLKSATAPKN